MKRAELLVKPVILATILLVIILAACSSEDEFAVSSRPTPPATTVAATEPAGPTATPWAWFRTFAGGNRDDLSICVDGAGGLSASDADVELVRDGLDSITANLGEKGYLSYIVEAKTPQGCPEPPLELGKAINKYEAARLMYRLRVPSEHFVFVYFLPEDIYQATFGDEPYFGVGVEMCCMTGNDASVTYSVYSTRSIDEDTLGQALMHAMGFADYCAPGAICPTRLLS